MESWEAKHRERKTKPTEAAFKAVYKELGGEFGTAQALWYVKSERKNCKRFNPVTT